MVVKIRAVCVFCGSSDQGDPAHRDAARRLGGILGEAGLDLVFGGGRVGLMGACADGALSVGGRVAGVIPQGLVARELAHEGVADMTVTDGMHARKAAMFARSDAFIVLPGGYGTLDELFETLTWRQLGYHRKPIAIVNPDGYWDALCALFADIGAAGYAPASTLEGVHVVDSVEQALPALRGEG